MAIDWSEERREYFDSLYMQGVSSEHLERIFGFTKDQIETWGGEMKLKQACVEIEESMTDVEAKSMAIVFGFFNVDNAYDLRDLLIKSPSPRRELMKVPGIGVKRAVDLMYLMKVHVALRQ